MGAVQAEEPVFGKEGDGPADVVVAAADPFPTPPFAQDVTQPATDPAVERRKRRAVAVLEVFKPAPQRPVEIGDDHGQAVARGPAGFRPDRVLELLQALPPRPALAGRKLVAEKVKAAVLRVDQPGL